MLGGVFDPFSKLSGNSSDAKVITPGIHVGIVKRYISNTHSCIVLVPSVNDSDPIGPIRIMRPFHSGAITQPSINSKVIVAFIDGQFNNAVILGYLG